MGYQERMKQHLRVYKQEVLNVSEDGIWPGNGKSYPHILPRDCNRLNILPCIRDCFWSWKPGNVRCHQYFHHLNSSQALCFNLFYPFLTGTDQDRLALLSALRLPTEELRVWRFEHVIDSEEGTNFDLFLEYVTGQRVFMEVKLTERGFGGAKNDEYHRHKLRTIYTPLLRDKVSPEWLRTERFFPAYQLLRNACHLRHNDRLVLLFPRENTAIVRGTATLDSAIMPNFRSQITSVYLEDVARHLRTSHPPQRTLMDEFCRKYLLPAPSTRTESGL